MNDATSSFHPAVQEWLVTRYEKPTRAQELAWPKIRTGEHVLVAAPTGSGKTLCAFVNAINSLYCAAECGRLKTGTLVLYISPLKALSRDIELNLKAPLEGVDAVFRSQGIELPRITSAVRTGDTPPTERARQAKAPPHILVTTPESLYILLTSESGRNALKTVETVIVDEIHALVRDKRGAHLSLSLERLDDLLRAHGGRKAQRIGLSATQNPIAKVAAFLAGYDAEANLPRPCHIVDVGHTRQLDLGLVTPLAPLSAVMSAESWSEIYDQLAQLATAHKTTLVFLNTRRLVERVARFLSERLGNELVASHHGSLSKERRFAAEQKLKNGTIRVLVASASLELGIDVGDVELVCQLGSPRSIATFLQRVGRSGHFVGGVPKGRLFPLSRDDLVECVALLNSVRSGHLDLVTPPNAPLDILAQQIVASAVPEEWSMARLFSLIRGASPYHDLPSDHFQAVVGMLADGFATARGRRGALIHFDAVGQRVKARRSARLIATTNGGAIADNFEFDVLLLPQDLKVGSVHEDFAVESSPGDVFQLGNTSYQVQRVESGSLVVSDAQGAPPSLPFWLGEAPGRTPELSQAISTLRETVATLATDSERERFVELLKSTLALSTGAAQQLVEYLWVARIELGHMPTQTQLVAERFFDEAGNMHLVIHCPYGMRLNRGFGLALRKRFCRSFNVELQAAANDDAIVMSLGPMHSFPLETVFQLLHSSTVGDVLTQAVLDAPLFNTRFRWNASRALAVQRFRGGKRVPPKFQRMDSDDLLAVCFPDQVACLENVGAHREIPEHPLVQQTLNDCLTEAMDLDGLKLLLSKVESGEVTTIARDLTAASSLAHEVLNARPYAFLDDAPLEERRTQAIHMRRMSDLGGAKDLGALNPQAIEQVLHDITPGPRDADELHDALLVFGFLLDSELSWSDLVEQLVDTGRAHVVHLTHHWLLIAHERVHWFGRVYPQSHLRPTGPNTDPDLQRDTALVHILRSRLELCGPISANELALLLALPEDEVQFALVALEQEGFVLRGHFRPETVTVEFCERRLLARIHRLTLSRLRREIEPVTQSEFVDFLTHVQGVHPSTRRTGMLGTLAIIEQLSGYPAAASSWESGIFPRRVSDFSADQVDQLTQLGRVSWRAQASDEARQPRFTGATSILLTSRSLRDIYCAQPALGETSQLISADAQRTLEVITEQGALFLEDVRHSTRLLPSQLELALSELLATGLLTCDSFSGARHFFTSAKRLSLRARPGRARPSKWGDLSSAGRFSRVVVGAPLDPNDEDGLSRYAFHLLNRWGVVFKQLLDREQLLIPWSELRRVFSQLEARGEIRGGRFVAHISGEQFATKEAISLLRQVRRDGPSSQPCVLSAYDPLNLAGIITKDRRVPRARNSHVLLMGGQFLASREAGKIMVFPTSSPPLLSESAIRTAFGPPWIMSSTSDSTTHLREKLRHSR